MKNHPIIIDNAQLIRPIKLSENIVKFQTNYGWGANIIASFGNDGILLADSGYYRVAEILKTEIAKFSKSEIKLIINSHNHSDHTGGNFLLSPDGAIIVHQNSIDNLIEKTNKVGFIGSKIINFNNEEIFLKTLEGGHSNSDIIIYFKNANIIYLGDMYLSESFPLIGNKRANNPTKLIENLKYVHKIINLDTKVISGHGRDSTKADLKAYINMVSITIKLVRDQMKSGRTLSEIKKMDILKVWEEWGGKIEFITKESWISDIYQSFYWEF